MRVGSPPPIPGRGGLNRSTPGSFRGALTIAWTTGPAGVIVWAHLGETADPAQLAALLAAPERPVLIAAAGPGWRAADLPDGVLRLTSLSEALAAATAADAASTATRRLP